MYRTYIHVHVYTCLATVYRHTYIPDSRLSHYLASIDLSRAIRCGGRSCSCDYTSMSVRLVYTAILFISDHLIGLLGS